MGQATTVLIPAILHSPLLNQSSTSTHTLKCTPGLATYAFNLMRWKHHFDGRWHNTDIISELRNTVNSEKTGIQRNCISSHWKATWGTEEPRRQVQNNGSVPTTWPQSYPVLSSGSVNLSLPTAHPSPCLFSRVRCRLRGFVQALATESIIYFPPVYFSIHSYMWTPITYYCFSIVHLWHNHTTHYFFYNSVLRVLFRDKDTVTTDAVHRMERQVSA